MIQYFKTKIAATAGSAGEISIPNTPGVYILQITVNGTIETHKIVVE